MILEQLEILIRNIVSENAFPVLAKVDRIDTKNYVCDCIELSNTGEETNTIYARVAIPKLWGTSQGGIWMAPSKGAVVLLNFLNGDRNYPVIAAVMGSSAKESAPEDTLLIKIGTTEIRLDDNIKISAGTTEISLNNNRTIGIRNSSASLAKLLKDMIGDISLVKTADGKPLSPDDIIKLQAFAGENQRTAGRVKGQLGRNNMVDLGTDIALDAEGEIVLEYADMALVEGKGCLLQDMRTRLMTDIGALFYDTAFGSGVLRYIQAPADELTLLELKAAVKDALETETRIDSSSIAVKVSADKEGILTAAISFATAENSSAVNLVLSLDGKITLYEV